MNNLYEILAEAEDGEAMDDARARVRADAAADAGGRDGAAAGDLDRPQAGDRDARRPRHAVQRHGSAARPARDVRRSGRRIRAAGPRRRQRRAVGDLRLAGCQPRGRRSGAAVFGRQRRDPQEDAAGDRRHDHLGPDGRALRAGRAEGLRPRRRRAACSAISSARFSGAACRAAPAAAAGSGTAVSRAVPAGSRCRYRPIPAGRATSARPHPARTREGHCARAGSSR